MWNGWTSCEGVYEGKERVKDNDGILRGVIIYNIIQSK
jgi:hypothetical protein